MTYRSVWLVAALSLVALVPASAVAKPRVRRSDHVRLQFDSGWKFRRDPFSKQVRAGSLVWVWQAASVSSIDAAFPGYFYGPDWKSTQVGADVFRGRKGFVWYRANLGGAQKVENLTLHFESVDDNAAVFLNGKRVFTHEGWSEPFDVPLAKVWSPAGPNVVTVLVENTDGPGGISGGVWLENPKPEAAAPEAVAGFDDAKWRTVHLPHDYVVEGTFDRTADNSHGSLPVAAAWYRKTFVLPASYKGKAVWVDFDGVYRKSTVYLNGHKLGDWGSGYMGFRYDLSKWAKFGGSNVLAVRVDPRQPEGWWYEGGGIYRHVWLNVANPVHVKPWGTCVQSLVNLSAKTADLIVKTSVDNDTTGAQNFTVSSRVLDPKGRAVLILSSPGSLAGKGEREISQVGTVKNVQLWSLETPQLYRLETTILRGGKVVDRQTTPFGLRTIRFDKDKGFFLNEKHVELKGTCNHQDHAGVGIAMPDGLLDWRISKLKEMGSNAYRCSHNPPAAELLEACDRQGMLVMDETRHLGDATGPKTGHGTKFDDLSELKGMILRDRNHPSVIMWSMANEEPLQGTAEGAKIFTAMRDVVRKLDPTRPITSAMNGGWGQGYSQVEDLMGFNYGIGSYDRIRSLMPGKPMYGSETSSTVSTRGIYANDPVRGYVSAYDLNAPGWGATAEAGWEPIARRPWMAGEFVWTGFDYKGEPTPYAWPCINSHFGIMDICGFPKDIFYYYQAWWGDKPMVHLLPHWNWKGREGQTISVWAFSNADEVELFLNGKSLGRQAMPKYEHVEWDVPYQPGTLVAKGYRNGQVISTDRVETAGAPASLRLKATRPAILADGEDLCPVEVEVLDAQGRVVPTASDLVTFRVVGPASVVGVGNGDPSSHEPDKASQRRAFNGKCMALVGAAGRGGKIVVEARSGRMVSRVTIVVGAVRRS